MTKEVAGIGLTIFDQSLVFKKLPKEDTKGVALKDFDGIGGPVPIALFYLRRLGWNVRLLSSIGDDSRADSIKRSLQEEGFDTRFLVEQQGKKSPTAHIWIDLDGGTRTIGRTPNLEPLQPYNVTPAFLDGISILHLDGNEHQAALYAAEKAQENQIRVTYDTGTYKENSVDLLKFADVVQAPLSFVEKAKGIDDLGEAVYYLRTLGPKVAVVTDGINGLAYSTSEGVFFQDAFRVDNVVDSNGAGDIFAGGLLHGLLENKCVEDAVRFASASAALKCQNFGKDKLPTVEEVQRLISLDKKPYG